MRYKPGHKEEMRAKMVTAASHSFREHGFAGVGVDGLAKAAGVTSGAFYTHFGSKDAAFNAALRSGLDEVIAAVPMFQRDHGTGWIQAFTDYYLGKAHRDDLACGCAMTTLSPEVTRSNPDMHAVYESGMTRIVDLLADGLAGGTNDERRARAWAFLGILIGGLTMARASKSNKITNEIATAIKIAALVAAGDTTAMSDI